MRNNMKSAFLFISVIILNLTICFAQNKDYLPETREVILHKGDSSIKITVLVKTEEIDTESDITYHWMKRDKIHVNKGGYTGNLLHGEYIIFNAHEKMICKGMFEQGKKIGEWQFWYPNGNIEHTEVWKNGKREGDFLYYSPDGTFKFEREYQNDEEIIKAEKTEKENKQKFLLFRKKEKKEDKKIKEETAEEKENQSKEKNPTLFKKKEKADKKENTE